MYSKINYISYYLPENNFNNDDACKIFTKFTPEKIFEKTGIKNRTISNKNDFVSDLATKACEILFSENNLDKSEIDYLILCTQSPDYLLPTTACIVHERLGLNKWCGAIDINQGCSGFIYSLGVAKALIETRQAKKVLLVSADTYTKHLENFDHSTRTIFGDGAAAVLMDGSGESEIIGPFKYGTDGSGAKNLISHLGGLKNKVDENKFLFMNGPEIFRFTLKAIPQILEKLFSEEKINLYEFDYIVFHQANKFMLDTLRKKLAIPDDKFLIFMEDHGNTVSSSIPITLSHYIKNKKIKRGHKLLLVGFGVGYSFASVKIIF